MFPGSMRFCGQQYLDSWNSIGQLKAFFKHLFDTISEIKWKTDDLIGLVSFFTLKM